MTQYGQKENKIMKLLKTLLLATALITSSQAIDNNFIDKDPQTVTKCSVSVPVIDNNWPALMTYMNNYWASVSSPYRANTTNVMIAINTLEQIERLGLANTTAVTANADLIRQQIFMDQLQSMQQWQSMSQIAGTSSTIQTYPGVFGIGTTNYPAIYNFLYYRSCHTSTMPMKQEACEDVSCLDWVRGLFS